MIPLRQMGSNKVDGIYARQEIIDTSAGVREGPCTLKERTLQLELPENQKGPQLVSFISISTFRGLLPKPGSQKGPYTTAYNCSFVSGTNTLKA